MAIVFGILKACNRGLMHADAIRQFLLCQSSLQPSLKFFGTHIDIETLGLNRSSQMDRMPACGE